MCGIAGFIGPGNQSDLTDMTRRIAHRGPDGEGFWQDSQHPVWLGHRRLAIVDIAGGHQPMGNADGSVQVVFNGEIYNHQDLRRELQAEGYQFASDHSDTEVLIHGWRAWGEALPLKLNGMFAFAIWDRQRRSLFMARDRFGEKPLYWSHQNNLFLFGSELSVFGAHRHFNAVWDTEALQKYFAWGFMPGRNAALKQCEMLEPGHALRYDLDSNTARITCWWRFSIDPLPSPPSFEEASEEVAALLSGAVSRRLMSDVPLGVFLSGGIDSSSIAAHMCRLLGPEKVSSFAIGFTEKSFDESAYAGEMADFLGCRHHSRVLDFDKAIDLMPGILQRLDEPMADPSLLPTSMLCGFAREHVTVALGGDGGDELFAGYDPFKALKAAGFYERLMPRAGHKMLVKLADRLPRSARNMSLDYKIRRFLAGMGQGEGFWIPGWMSPLSAPDITALFDEPVAAESLYEEALDLWQQAPAGHSLVDKSLEYFTRFYLADDILTKVDRASMHHGLEARAVFLDNDLVDYVRRLPASYKYDGRTTKKLLKSAVSRLIPDSIANRPKKGFGVPLRSWLQDLDIDRQPLPHSGMNAGVLQQLLDQDKSGARDMRLFCWAWIVLASQQNLAGTQPV